MIDFHSHILPAVDDGSASVEESVALLKMLSEQGIDTVCATPHFDPLQDSPASFLEKRNKAFELLKKETEGLELPCVKLGAEVMYFSGIGNVEDMSMLKIEGTNLLLLEMPMAAWSDFTVKELVNMSSKGHIRIMLAHIERYLALQKAATLEKLLDNGVVMQVNASFFINPKTRRRALKMLKNGEIHLLGSDCHNTEFRPPRMSEALKIIDDKLGEDFVFSIESRGNYFLKNFR